MFRPRRILAFQRVALAVLAGILFRGLAACGSEAYPLPFVTEQPDGKTKIQLHPRGNEFAHWLETDEGYTVVRQRGRAPGFYVYAIDQRGRREAASLEAWTSDRRVGIDPPPVDRALRYAPIPFSARSPAHFQVAGPQAHITSQLTADPSDRDASHRVHATASPTRGTIEVRNLVIPVRFANHKNRVLPTKADLEMVFNVEGGHPAHVDAQGVRSGSVRDLYLQNSYGKFDLVSTVVDWVDLPQNEAYYADNDAGRTGRVREIITDSLNGLVARGGVTFKDFDRDLNGWIDAIAFVHSGYGAEWMQDDVDRAPFTDRIWSHRWWLTDNETWISPDEIKVRDYHISPGLWGLKGSEPCRIGVISHETGHFFGLPDLYDTSGRGSGDGSWELMANSWGFKFDQLQPPHFSAYSKAFLGWLRPEIVEHSGVFTVPAIEREAVAWKIPLDTHEYLLVENREPILFDRQIPAGDDGVAGGLAIWHVDEAKNSDENSVNANGSWPGDPGWPGTHNMLSLLQADGQFQLEKPPSPAGPGNRGDGNDLYRKGYFDRIDEGTVPSTRPYREKTAPAAGTWPTIDRISAAGETMTFRFDDRKKGPDSKPVVILPLESTAGAIASCSAQFEWKPGSPRIIDAHGTILSAKITLPAEMDVQIRADTSVSGANGVGTFVTGIHDSDTADYLMWPGSMRSTTAADGQWVNVGTSHAVRLPKGDHTISWKIWIYNGKLTLDSGTLTINAFPVSQRNLPNPAAGQLGFGPATRAPEATRLDAAADPEGTIPSSRPSQTGKQTRVALVIGIDKYKHLHALRGCKNDADDMTRLLRRYHFDVTSLVDDKATSSNILDAFQSLLDRFPGPTREPEATVVIHISSHGSQVADLSGDELDDHRDETICTHDSLPGGRNDITDDQIFGFTSRLAEKVGRVVLILDTCHSGLAAKGLLSPRAPSDGEHPGADPGPDSDRRFFENPPRGSEDIYDQRRYVLISACLANRSAYEIEPHDLKRVRGALTYHVAKYLRQSWQRPNVPVTYRSMLDQVGPRVRADAWGQEPQLQGPLLANPVFEVGESPSLQPYVRASRKADGTFSVDAGAAVGMTAGSEFELYGPDTVEFPIGAGLATLRLTDVAPFASNGRVTTLQEPKELEALDRSSDVVTFLAVERKHVFDSGPISVLLDAPVNGDLPPELRTVQAAIEDDEQLKGHFALVRSGEARLVLGVLTYRGQTRVTLSHPGPEPKPVSEFDPTKSQWVGQVVKELQDWGRWFRVRDLRNSHTDIDVSFKLVLPSGVQEPPRQPDDPGLVVFAGEVFRVDIHNRTPNAYYFYILNLVDNGWVLPFLPPPSEVGANPQLRANADWSRETEEVMLVPGRDENREGLLLLVTEKPIDVIPLLIARTSAAKGHDDPLVQLLTQSALNDRPTIIRDDPGRWYAEYYEYKIVKPPKK